MSPHIVAALSRLIQAELKQLEMYMKCPLCKEWYKQPVSGTCGHKYCERCIIPYLHDRCQCPLCHFPLWRCDLYNAISFQNIVDAIQNLLEISEKCCRNFNATSDTENASKLSNEDSCSTAHTLDKKSDANSSTMLDAIFNALPSDGLVDSEASKLQSSIGVVNHVQDTPIAPPHFMEAGDIIDGRGDICNDVMMQFNDCEGNPEVYNLLLETDVELKKTCSLMHIIKQYMDGHLDTTAFNNLNEYAGTSNDRLQTSLEFIDAYESAVNDSSNCINMKESTEMSVHPPHQKVPTITAVSTSEAVCQTIENLFINTTDRDPTGYHQADDQTSINTLKTPTTFIPPPTVPTSTIGPLQPAVSSTEGIRYAPHTEGLSYTLNEVPHQLMKEIQLPVILGTALTQDHMKEMHFAINTLGGRVDRDISDEVTHLVVEVDDNSCAISRTVKYMKGVLMGKWILKVSWISESLNARKWLPEDSFEIAGDAFALSGAHNSRVYRETALKELYANRIEVERIANKLGGPMTGVVECLKVPSSSPKALFDGMTFCLDFGKNSKFVPPLSDLHSIVMCGGGASCSWASLPCWRHPIEDEITAFIGATHTEGGASCYSHRRVIVLLDSTVTKYEVVVKILKTYEVSVAPIKWLFDCISSHKRLDCPSIISSFQREL